MLDQYGQSGIYHRPRTQQNEALDIFAGPDRSVGRGLAKVEPLTSDTLIAFAAKAGSVAQDGEGKTSPFTTALINHVATPGLDLRIAFGQVRDDVLRATANRQEPFVYGSLGGGVVSLVAPPEPKVLDDGIAEARRDYYEFLNGPATKEAWGDFLQLHPTGPYANLARTQLAKLVAAEKAKAAEDAKAAEKAAVEKAAAERAAAEKAIADKAAADKAAAEKAAAERRAQIERERASTKAAEKAAAEKAAAGKDAAEKAAAEKAAIEKVGAEKAAADKRVQTERERLARETEERSAAAKIEEEKHRKEREQASAEAAEKAAVQTEVALNRRIVRRWLRARRSPPLRPLRVRCHPRVPVPQRGHVTEVILAGTTSG